MLRMLNFLFLSHPKIQVLFCLFPKGNVRPLNVIMFIHDTFLKVRTQADSTNQPGRDYDEIDPGRQTIANKKEASEAMPRVQLDVWNHAVQTKKPNSICFKYVFVS